MWEGFSSPLRSINSVRDSRLQRLPRTPGYLNRPETKVITRVSPITLRISLERGEIGQINDAVGRQSMVTLTTEQQTMSEGGPASNKQQQRRTSSFVTSLRMPTPTLNTCGHCSTARSEGVAPLCHTWNR